MFSGKFIKRSHRLTAGKSGRGKPPLFSGFIRWRKFQKGNDNVPRPLPIG
jgi:hypothetical protein